MQQLTHQAKNISTIHLTLTSKVFRISVLYIGQDSKEGQRGT